MGIVSHRQQKSVELARSRAQDDHSIVSDLVNLLEPDLSLSEGSLVGLDLVPLSKIGTHSLASFEFTSLLVHYLYSPHHWH